jgi:nitrite reductase/ring-hydroxylating ferredoxin subunit
MFDFALPDSLRDLDAATADALPEALFEALFEDRAVFRAEFAHIFGRPWMAVDHVDRLPAVGSFFAFDVVRRSILVVRAGAARYHALRNRCIHAGYPLCEVDDGRVDKLHCRYHGWEYALDGRLTAAPQVADGFRLEGQRLPVYPLSLWQGLILVHPSMQEDPDAAPEPAAAPPVPDWFADCHVRDRQQVKVAANWKLVRAALPLADDADCVVFGPLSLLLAQPDGAVLLRLVPRGPQETRVESLWLAADDAPPRRAGIDAPVAGCLQRIAALPTTDARPRLDPAFLRWYRALLPSDAAA